MTPNLHLRCLVFLTCLGIALSATAQRTIGYMPYWAGDVSQIQYSKLTHLNYAFALPTANGSIKAIDDPTRFRSLVSLAHASNVKVLISIGGWSDGGTPLDPTFETLAASVSTRSTFITAAMSLVSTYNLDGVDIDWEYPTSGTNSANYDLLMSGLYDQLKPMNKLLSAAVSADSYNGVGISMTAVAKMDFVNVMAYDANNYDHSTFTFAVDALNYWVGRGVPKNKLNLGVPFYGKSASNGEIPFSTILSSGGSASQDTFNGIGYNGIPTMKQKAQYVKDNAYGGLMIWELAEDATGSNSLLTAISQVFGTVSPPANQAPVVSLTAPTNGTSLTAPATFNLTATASDADGSVSKVDFYNGTTLLFSDNTAPYAYSWTSVTAGSYTLLAKATDNGGLVTTSSTVNVTVTTVAANQAPVVSLTAPTNGTSLTAPATFNLTASASDADGSVSKVDFYNGTTLLFSDNTAPYAYSWTGIASGSYTLSTKATDNGGLVTTSTAVSVTVTSSSGNQAPSVLITAPVNNGTYNAPAAVTIMVNASDADGTVSKVDFYNGATLIGSDNTSPYYITWSGVGGGTFVVTAVATDNAGATKTSTPINVVVYGAVTPPANQPPAVSLTAPTNGTSLTAPATFNLAATASDADGSVSKVDFYNGTTLLFSDNTAPYAYSWTGVAAGSYTLLAKATDNEGLVTTSTTVNVTATAVAVNQAPVVSLTAPTNGTSLTVPAIFNLTASASDADGSVSKVDFYNGTTLLFSDNTAPYAYSWTGVAAGSYTLLAKATDNGGLVTTSTAVSFTVTTAATGTCTAASWNSTVAYVGGNVVVYAGIKYKANWWTQGDRPDLNNGVYGTGKVWTSQGACNSRTEYVDETDQANGTQTLSLAPNPVEQSSTVQLHLEANDQVQVYTLDAMGRKINDIYSGELSSGTHSFSLDASTMAPGMYYLILKGQHGTVTSKFIKN
ncbi:MAG: large protein [Chitinophagaceae bacterium]|nr:large protein [Chitinophagaceae bacterium]